ncbi:hypothetical protein EK904_001799 [Melospiza melodia maxima]|nr:hypothetical protein EK904_001799 [Melospiza melodia maxima]
MYFNQLLAFAVLHSLTQVMEGDRQPVTAKAWVPALPYLELTAAGAETLLNFTHRRIKSYFSNCFTKMEINGLFLLQKQNILSRSFSKTLTLQSARHFASADFVRSDPGRAQVSFTEYTAVTYKGTMNSRTVMFTKIQENPKNCTRLYMTRYPFFRCLKAKINNKHISYDCAVSYMIHQQPEENKEHPAQVLCLPFPKLLGLGTAVPLSAPC